MYPLGYAVYITFEVSMSTEWLVPLGLIVLAILTPDTTLNLVFVVLGLVMLGCFMAKSEKDK
jgi:hypothetical protein